MSKHKHRRTQSNSEVDLRNALCQQDDKRNFIEIFHQASQAQPQIPEKEIIIEKLEDDYSLQHLKENCGLNFGSIKKKQNITPYQPNNLFLIPEQNDLLSSVEQTQESGKKLAQNQNFNQQVQKRPTHSVEQKNNNDQKENKKNEHIRQKSSLITQIQVQLRDVTHLINNDKQDPQNKMTFTKELQKKKISYHQQSTNSNSTNKQEIQNDSFRKLENQMKKIEKEIFSLKQRQDSQETIQQQLLQVINESKKQREQGHLQLKKLEQLEIITRRNEESLQYLTQILGGSKRINQITHQTDSTDLSDQHRKFTDLKTFNRYL